MNQVFILVCPLLSLVSIHLGLVQRTVEHYCAHVYIFPRRLSVKLYKVKIRTAPI